jgi:hypothetical protein
MLNSNKLRPGYRFLLFNQLGQVLETINLKDINTKNVFMNESSNYNWRIKMNVSRASETPLFCSTALKIKSFVFMARSRFRYTGSTSIDTLYRQFL